MGGEKLKKGPWTREEDQKLLAYIEQHGHGSWRTLPPKAGLQRCGKSCRLRWANYLRPDIKRGKFSTHEEKTIIRLHALLGNRWSAIAAHLPKRTDNEIKNYWNTRLKKRLTRMGIDPTTHKPKNNPAGSVQSAALSHMAQWEAARLEAEARLTRESKLPFLRRLASPPPRPPPSHLAAPPCLDVLKVWQSSVIPSCFFSNTLDSPTSTITFSGNSLTVPTVSSAVTDDVDVVSMNEYGSCGGGGLEVEETECLNEVYPYDYSCGLVDVMEKTPFDQDSNNGDLLVGELEDSKNYWDYLLNLVMESPEL